MKDRTRTQNKNVFQAIFNFLASKFQILASGGKFGVVGALGKGSKLEAFTRGEVGCGIQVGFSENYHPYVCMQVNFS